MRNGDADGADMSVAKLMATIESGVTRLVETSISSEQDLNRIRAAKDAEHTQKLSTALMNAQIESQNLTARLEGRTAQHAEDLAKIAALDESIIRLEAKLELSETRAAAATDELAKWVAGGVPDAVRDHAGKQHLAALLAPRKSKPFPDSV